MDKFLKTSLGRFRLIAFTEGLSYLFLLFVAMPLKYLADMPLVVKYAGWVHGLLFVLFMLALLEVTIKRKWTFFRSEEHTSELQSLMRISYAVFCLKKKNYIKQLYNKINS